MNNLSKLQQWYASQCDGDWEHQFGIRIETLDNPGWKLDIDLTDTGLELKHFDEIQNEQSDNDWYFCAVQDNAFKGRGGPQNLNNILDVFLGWVDS